MPSERNQKRIDVLTGRQVIVANGRSDRPIQLFEPTISLQSYDPFLEGNERDTPGERLALRKIYSQANSVEWLLRVVPNRYPAVQEKVSIQFGAMGSADEASMQASGNYGAVFAQQPAIGVHDVVIECADDRSRLMQLSVIEVTRMLAAWQHRLRVLSGDPAILSVNIFRNEGFSAGASLSHCHSQILAVGFLPPQLEARLQAEHLYRSRSDVNCIAAETLHEHWLSSEISDGRRLMCEQDGLVVLCPFASRTPWQVRICPSKQEFASFQFAELSVQRLAMLAGRLLSCVLALDEICGSVAHNLTLSLPPTNASNAFPWMLDILPRPNRVAGFEMMTDVDIQTIAPEIAAERYRRVLKWKSADVSQSDILPDGFEWRASDLL